MGAFQTEFLLVFFALRYFPSILAQNGSSSFEGVFILNPATAKRAIRPLVVSPSLFKVSRCGASCDGKDCFQSVLTGRLSYPFTKQRKTKDIHNSTVHTVENEGIV